MMQPGRSWQCEVLLYVGPSGVGKTRAIAKRFKPEDIYMVSPPRNKGESVWFDGYSGQSVVVLDEFYGWIPWSFLLRLLDSTALQVGSKGGMRQFLAKTLVITSNAGPHLWYKDGPFINPDALYRRITWAQLWDKDGGLHHFENPGQKDGGWIRAFKERYAASWGDTPCRNPDDPPVFVRGDGSNDRYTINKNKNKN